ncbi:hypothetical protein EV182_004395, partial [Spiromyces aspiralis]
SDSAAKKRKAEEDLMIKKIESEKPSQTPNAKERLPDPPSTTVKCTAAKEHPL